MDNPVQLTTYEETETKNGKKNKKTKKHNTICVGHHYTQTNTNAN